MIYLFAILMFVVSLLLGRYFVYSLVYYWKNTSIPIIKMTKPFILMFVVFTLSFGISAYLSNEAWDLVSTLKFGAGARMATALVMPVHTSSTLGIAFFLMFCLFYFFKVLRPSKVKKDGPLYKTPSEGEKRSDMESPLPSTQIN